MAEASSWLVWQLADSAFPSGGFAHSGGLEAAWQLGEVRSREDLVSFAETFLAQLGRSSLPFVMGVFRDSSRFLELDQRCDLLLNNHVANRASRLQGKAFLTVVQRSLTPGDRSNQFPAGPSSESACHLAPVVGWVTQAFRLPEDTAARLFLYINLRGLISAAVRLGVIGPMDGQTLQSQMSGAAENVAQTCSSIPAEEAWQTAPLMDMFQGAQDRLYSRLFQS